MRRRSSAGFSPYFSQGFVARSRKPCEYEDYDGETAQGSDLLRVRPFGVRPFAGPTIRGPTIRGPTFRGSDHSGSDHSGSDLSGSDHSA
ncbi:hypothetical protein APED_30330 [Acanthopleuribacter pedis]